MSTDPSPVLGDLVSTEMLTGLNEQGDPFVQLRVTGTSTEGSTVSLLAHVPVDVARQIGTQYLQVAEAAISDAAVASFLVGRLSLVPEVALRIIGDLREHRKDATDWTDTTPDPTADGDAG